MKKILGIIVFLLVAHPAFAAPENLYYGQSSAGSANGADCANRLALSSLAWSASDEANKINAGDTMHLCGTITGTAGQNIIAVGASGTDLTTGAITIQFETNAILQADYLGANDTAVSTGGGIYIIGRSNIIVDGGTNGIIQATANGTLLANQEPSTGVYVGEGSSNIKIRNLTIRHMYVTKTDCTDGSSAGNSGAIMLQQYGANNAINDIEIYDNILSDARLVLYISFGGGGNPENGVNNILIHDNTFDLCGNGCIVAGDRGSGASLEHISVYNNTIGGKAYYYYDAADNNHLNGLFFFVAANSHIDDFNIYGNTFQMEFGTGICPANHSTASLQVDCTSGAGGADRYCSGKVYNNVFTFPAAGDWANNGHISMSGVGTRTIYSNTLIGNGVGNAMAFGYVGTSLTVKNNIVKDFQYFSYGVITDRANESCTGSGTPCACCTGSGTGTCTGITTFASSSNLFYNITQPDNKFVSIGCAGDSTTDYHSQTTWAGHGYDSDNTLWDADPLFVSSSDFTLQSGSPAKDKGATLGSPYNVDKNGVSRPQGAAYDIGAYEYEAPQTILKSWLGSGAVGSGVGN